MEIIAFGAVSFIILLSSIFVVVSRDMVHSALSLAMAFIGIAALFILLEAEFLAVIQVLIYAGAVVVLMLFAVMLTKRKKEDYR
jgi:NADH-quinone oxidoreductase subunit J